MRSSWACCWLLLAWALLLGQPVSGEVSSSRESWDSGEALGSPSSGEHLSQELGDSREGGDSAPEAEVGHGEASEEGDLEEVEDLEPELTSEELLERRASSYREDSRRWGLSPFSHYKYMALRFMQLKGDEYEYDDEEDEEEDEENPKVGYRFLEDSSMTIQKAIGNVMKFRMFLTKGVCTDERLRHDDYLDYILSLRHRPRQPRTCKKLDCVFTVFQDVRTGHDAVINSECYPLMLEDDLPWQYSPLYRGLMDDDLGGLTASHEEVVSHEETPDFQEDSPEEPNGGLSSEDVASNEDTPDLHDDTPDRPDSGGNDSPDY